MEGTSADSPPWSQVRLDVGAFDVQVNQTLSAVSSPQPSHLSGSGLHPPHLQQVSARLQEGGWRKRGNFCQVHPMTSRSKRTRQPPSFALSEFPSGSYSTLSRGAEPMRAQARPKGGTGPSSRFPHPFARNPPVASPMRSRRSDELIHGHQHRGDGEARGNCPAYN